MSPTMKPLLYLIGYRGTGKTTVGQLLAHRLGWDFVDADVHLEAKRGKTIKEIFASDGEASFRDSESATLRELSARARCVIATGGGIVLREKNAALLRTSGFVVWLTADASTLAQRIQADPTTTARRPNLSMGGMAEIEELLRVREPFYRECADLEIDASGTSPESIVETILKGWTSCNSRSPTSSG